MGWKVYADLFDSGELGTTALSIAVTPTKDIILRAVRTWVVVHDDPVFTSLSMKIYSNSGGTPGQLIHTSTDSRLKAEIHTLDYGIKEIYFTFDDVSLEANDTYHFVMAGVGYSPTANSYLAWVKAWPDPVLGGYVAATTTLGRAPYALYLIGGGF